MAWTTPRTWTVGDVLTAAAMNQHLRDQLSWLYGDTGWTTVTPLSPWALFASAGWQDARYRRVGRLVILDGLLTSTTAANSSVPFVLPVGYRPANRILYPALRGTDMLARIDIDPSGNVYVATAQGAAWGSSWVSFTGGLFQAAGE